MTTDLEADLRREFDAVGVPTGLTFSPESVLRQGSRTIRRHRITAVGSAAMAVGLIAVGSTLMTRPHDTAAPQPATRTATTGTVTAQAGFIWGQSEVQFNRDPKVQSNVRYSVMAKDGKWHEVGRASTREPGQKADATWWSGIVDGHPVTIGVLPSPPTGGPTITFADGGSYGIGSEELKGTGYTMFYVQYSDDATHKEPARPAEIASIRWTDATSIVDGIEGGHRLTGRVLTLSQNLSIEVVLRPGDGGQTTVFGSTRLTTPTRSQFGSKGGYGFDLSTATTTDRMAVAIVTGRQPILEAIVVEGKQGVSGTAGPPVAAGILPPGSSGVGWILTTGAAASPLVVSEGLPDGSLIFAIKVPSAQESDCRKASVKAVTWTNADSTRGRQDVTQQQG